MATTAEQGLGNGHAHRICFIDDSRTSAFVTKKLLKQFGYEVDHFPAAEAAIDAIMERDYSALITDLMISSNGGVNGDDLIRLVRNCGHPTKSKIPILVVTGSASTTSHQELVKTGANAVLLKPLDGPQLDRELRSAIQLAAKSSANPPPRAAPVTASVTPKFSATYFAELPLEQAPSRTPTYPAETPLNSAAVRKVPDNAVDEDLIPTLTQAVSRESVSQGHKTARRASPASSHGNNNAQDNEQSHAESLTLQQIAAQNEAAIAQDRTAAPSRDSRKPQQADSDRRTRSESVAKNLRRPPSDFGASGFSHLDQNQVSTSDLDSVIFGSPEPPAPKSSAKPPVTPDSEVNALGVSANGKRGSGDDALLSLLNQLDNGKKSHGGAPDGPFATPGSKISFAPHIKKIVKVAILIAILAPAVFFMVTREQAPELVMATVTQGSVSTSIKATGKVVSRRKVALTPYYAGLVAKINVKDGDSVKKGDVLFRLDDRDVTSNLKRAQAKLISVQELVAQTGKTLERLQNALDSGAVSRKMVEDAEAEWKAAAADQGVVEEDLKVAKLALERVELVAPFDGVVSGLSAQLGQWLTPPEPGLTLIDVSQREIEFSVSGAEANHLRSGAPVAIFSEASPDKKIDGEVVRVDDNGKGDAQKNRISAFAKLKGDAPKMSLGQSVTVEVQASSDDKSMKIPVGALIMRNGQRMVAIDRNGHVQFLSVVTGVEGPADVEITQGLAVGQKVVIPGGNELVEGQKLRAAAG